MQKPTSHKYHNNNTKLC